MKCKCPEVESVNASSGASPALPFHCSEDTTNTAFTQTVLWSGHVADFSPRNIAIMKSATYIPKMNTIRQRSPLTTANQSG